MFLLPRKTETLVLPYSRQEVINSLKRVTEPVSRTQEVTGALFVGTVDERAFRVSKKVEYPQNFLPIITGHVETTTRGSIVFLRFNLFFSSQLFLIFWSSLCLFFSFFFSFIIIEYIYAVICIIVGLLNYCVVLVNFRRQVKISHAALEKALNIG